MYRVVNRKLGPLPDEARFLETLNLFEGKRARRTSGLFDAGRELVGCRAPGRLDVMGGIADYSGSLVLQLPIEEATYVALQKQDSKTLNIVTIYTDCGESSFEMSLADFEDKGGPIEYDVARRRFEADPSRRWAAYVAGVFLVLMQERRVRFEEGARILITSRVPEGKGVSSSAALEVAVMQAVAAAYSLDLSPVEVALLCQKVENRVVGAPCGIMDQMTASCGEPHRLLALLCQPAELLGMIEVPNEIAFWGLDSGERHAVSGSDYSSVRVGAFMGRRIISDLLGVEDDGTSWTHCLANLTPSQFEQDFAAKLPFQITGRDFIERYQGTVDSVTQIEPNRIYAVRAPAAHPVYENHRVRLFSQMIGDPKSETVLELLGELMYQSHASYSACGLGSKGTDLLVKLVRSAGRSEGLYGARITGGGSGGTVAVIGRAGAGSAIASVAEQYFLETGYRPQIFSGSSPGSAAFGHLHLEYAGLT